eukprot:COSAG01_NODE_1069_length_11875_cov_244.112716_3_plen_238_part_00
MYVGDPVPRCRCRRGIELWRPRAAPRRPPPITATQVALPLGMTARAYCCWLLTYCWLQRAGCCAAPPPLATVSFGQPHLLGQATYSYSVAGINRTIYGSRFWYPAYSIPTTRRTNGYVDVAQHVTLANDGGPCNDPRVGAEQTQTCEEIYITRDGGDSYQLVKKVMHGSSGNFNGCECCTPPCNARSQRCGVNCVGHLPALSSFCPPDSPLKLCALNMRRRRSGQPGAFSGVATRRL